VTDKRIREQHTTAFDRNGHVSDRQKSSTESRQLISSTRRRNKQRKKQTSMFSRVALAD